jgi:hypothetical protein
LVRIQAAFEQAGIQFIDVTRWRVSAFGWQRRRESGDNSVGLFGRRKYRDVIVLNGPRRLGAFPSEHGDADMPQ